MPVFPPAAPVAVLVDGRPLRSYASAYVQNGHVFVPLAPLVSHLADRSWFEGEVLVLQRDGRSVRVRVSHRDADELEVTFVPARAIFAQLGDDVDYYGRAKQLEIRVRRRAVVALPTPYAAPIVTIVPREIFTPSPGPMPQPAWTGPPLPRRTPLPNPPGAHFAPIAETGATPSKRQAHRDGEQE